MIAYNVYEQTKIPEHLAKQPIYEMTVSCGHDHSTVTMAKVCLQKQEKKYDRLVKQGKIKPVKGTEHKFWIAISGL